MVNGSQFDNFVSAVAELMPMANQNVRDDFDLFVFDADRNIASLPQIEAVISHAESCNLSEKIVLKIDKGIGNESIAVNEFLSIYKNETFDTWQLIFPKDCLSIKLWETLYTIVPFFDNKSFESYVAETNPILANNNFQKAIIGKTVFLVPKFGRTIFGDNVLITYSLDNITTIEQGSKSKWKFPEASDVKKQVHLLSDQPINIAPSLFTVNKILPAGKNEPFLRLNILTLAMCLVSEYYSLNRVTLKGIKRVELPAEKDSDSIRYTLNFSNILTEVVGWVYEESVETRRQLLVDRLSLDIEDGDTLVGCLDSNLEEAFAQSKEQYVFVIADRKDEYFKEYRSLLQDLQKQASYYSEKIRSLLSNLLRDVTAAMVLISFTVLTKFLDVKEAPSPKSQVIILKAIAAYFVVSLIIQSISSIYDLVLTDKEWGSWLESSRQYLSKNDISSKVQTPIKQRKLFFWINYAILGLIYIGLAYIILNLKELLAKLY